MAITLNDGTLYLACFGKYEPNLGILFDPKDKEHVNGDNSCRLFVNEDIRKVEEELNLTDSCLDGRVFGDFFTSKKGTKMFRVKADGKHQLLRDSWGGSFNDYRGGVLPSEGALYYRRASSNGGGTGYDYAIYPRDWKRSVSIDDL